MHSKNVKILGHVQHGSTLSSHSTSRFTFCCSFSISDNLVLTVRLVVMTQGHQQSSSHRLSWWERERALCSDNLSNYTASESKRQQH